MKRLAIDVESKDPELNTRGPGFIRGDAEVVGISMATDDESWYFPIGHLGGGNMNRDDVTHFVRETLSNPELYVVGANLQYEIEALASMDISIAGKLTDVQLIEALIDEEREDGYSLDDLCRLHLGTRKEEKLLREAADAYGVDPKGGLWKLHSRYVGEYAQYDAACCLKILDKQRAVIEADNLQQVVGLEMRLLPILAEMRLRGILIDMEGATTLLADLKVEEDKVRNALKDKVGWHVDVWSGPQLARLCDKLEIQYPRTLKGNPSFEGKWLEEFSNPVMQLVSDVREIDRMRSTFVDGWIFKNQVRGRIHPQWKQLASDDGGTRTGRLACSNPNAQQIPAAKKRNGTPNPWGARIRGLFISDTGLWLKQDYSQQEPRILTHFATLCNMTGAKLAAMAYNKDPKMDFYQFMVEAAGINRRMAKDMYLGRCYGMGKNKLAMKLNRPVDECEKILKDFDEKVPFVKEIADRCMQLAQTRGYIKTLCGRRRRFNYWEPQNSYNLRKQGHDTRPRPLKEAQEKWPKERLQRSNTHKALNALIQGSAADMMKSGIVKGFEEQGRVPYISVHDEVGGSVTDPDDAKKWQHIMEHCVEMCVPIRADTKLGKSWT